jgi:fatty-acyl-CoA synthase
VSLVGRLKELYISGGENVYPAEVERARGPTWRRSPSSACRTSLGRGGRAYVVPACATFDAAGVLAWASQRLALQAPREVVVVAELRARRRKVQKHALLART